MATGDHLRRDPLTSIRYNPKRLSSGDGGLDLGASRFSSDYQRDSVTGSGDDAATDRSGQPVWPLMTWLGFMWSGAQTS